MNHRPAELWFVCGSQHLYGPDALDEVAHNATAVAAGLAASAAISVPIVSKGVVTTPEEIRSLALAANSSEDCAGLIVWMHTFSPARMWIGGLSVLAKPFCHLHTQYGRDLPWATIDMDFMNLHQAAHGDREAGHLHTRMRLDRKVVVGNWQDPAVHAALDRWGRAAAAWLDLQGAPFARFGDNMRQVAVTEGDKVSAELRFGFSFQGYGVGDLAERVDAVGDGEIDELVTEYADTYDIAPELLPGADRHQSLRDGAAIELGLRSFLEEGGFVGFTTNFEDLHGLRQLPGLAVQRLMADGYGFGAEGDWKTAAMVRAVKVMGHGRSGGTSFMEDYTYHLDPDEPLVLGAHMLETCPTIAEGPVRLEVHPLGIGGKADPVRLVFDAGPGPAVTTCVVDLGNRFRMVTQDIETVAPPPMPNLPVGRAVWRTAAPFETATAGWILAGGSHHTVFSRDVDAGTLDDFATIAGVEHVHLGADADLQTLRRDLRTNEVYHLLANGLRG